MHFFVESEAYFLILRNCKAKAYNLKLRPTKAAVPGIG